jgi:rubrerythrin
VNFFRCRICGETYLGTKPPSRCPFCGVTEDFFVLTTDYHENGEALILSETETADVLHAIDLERGNARFYRALGGHVDNPKLASGFKRLANIEAEHCSIFCKLAGCPKPVDLLEPSDEHGTWCDGVNESLARELRASNFYAEVAGRARDPRVCEVFLAIGAVERDHIELDGIAAQIASCDWPTSVGVE